MMTLIFIPFLLALEGFVCLYGFGAAGIPKVSSWSARGRLRTLRRFSDRDGRRYRPQ